MKKNDISPLMDVVVLKAGQQMLTGSDPKINNGKSEKPSYSRQYNGFDEEDDEDDDF